MLSPSLPQILDEGVHIFRYNLLKVNILECSNFTKVPKLSWFGFNKILFVALIKVWRELQQCVKYIEYIIEILTQIYIA